MDEISPEFIERYQKIYAQDPRSRVFAPLAEAYRKIGRIKEGLEIARAGVKIHPDFAGGRVALGRLLLEDNNIADASEEFKKATEFAPENILAYQLLGESLLKLKKTRDALSAYKMLLFLNPDNSRALKAVQKLESLTADEYEDDLFAMKPLKEAVKDWDEFELIFDLEPHAKGPNISTEKDAQKSKFLDRVLSLTDAYIVRNDIDRALDALNEAERLIGANPEIVKRLSLIQRRQLDSIPTPKSQRDLTPPLSREKAIIDNQIQFLQDLLQNIKHHQT
jgi:tetratricopeptide (TPR) repeat protein